ncbi:flavin-containing monooxygenase 5-like [Oscarella lobularis]|uniref:flavin-containing monooxygenase 5-like n=1 Tax=Oscarella lobularis TaxID=121494 RepID=UPI0033140A38
MNAPPLTVAVIGAGASGLASIKCCLDDGLHPVCFEQQSDIGGLWRYNDDDDDDDDESSHGSVYWSTVINTSKEMMSYSDFCMPASFPPYMHHTLVHEYYQMYAKQFKLMERIRFNARVDKIEPAAAPDSSRWTVKWSNTKTGETKEEIFDKVLVCSGHHWKPNRPRFHGMDLFKGNQLHSHAYRKWTQFAGKTVLIVGLGNSGADIAVELSRHCKKVYLSTRSGAWIVPKFGSHGIPLDMIGNSRVVQNIPYRIRRFLSEWSLRRSHASHVFGLEPDHDFASSHPTMSDELLGRIATGSIVVKSNVRSIYERDVEFDDSSVVVDVDAIVYATGYDVTFSFFDERLFACRDNEINLYKYVFSPTLPPSIGFVGFFQPLGAVNPISEMQARWACRVFTGHCRLPSKETMERDVYVKRREIKRRYRDSRRHTMQVDYVVIMDELAALVGVRPNLLRLLFADFKLAVRCYFGPCVPAQYRLTGHGAWTGARDAIMNAFDNVTMSTRTRRVDKRLKRRDAVDRGWASVFCCFAVLVIVLSLCCLVFY